VVKVADSRANPGVKEAEQPNFRVDQQEKRFAERENYYF
jgi:hypothetical protein